MLHQPIDDQCRFRATTGAAFYDEIRFSMEPRGTLVGQPQERIGFVRHPGIAADAPASSASDNLEGDLIILNLSTGGHYERRGGGRSVRRALRRGDISFVPLGMMTELTYPASNSVLFVSFPADSLQAAVQPASISSFQPRYSESNRRIAQLIMLAESEVRAPGFAGDLLLDGVIRAIAALLSRQNDPIADVGGGRVHISPARLARVIDYIDASLHREISLSDLADIAQLSPFHFSRVFKLATGQSPYQFVCSCRLERAIRLLEQGALPLAQLALACGFSSQAHFTSAFSKAIGVSPGRYRRNGRQENIFRHNNQQENAISLPR